MLGVVPSRVAVGSQASVFIGLAAAAAPPGAEVVCVEGDFASVVRPFLARGDLRVRQVPLAELAGAVGPDTWMVAYALVSSSTGEVADAAAVSAAARATGARVLVDVTQATGWLPTTGLEADLVVCHTYKWLCAPRGSAFAALLRARPGGDPAAHRGLVLGRGPVGVLLRPGAGPGARREPVRRLAGLARLGRGRGRPRFAVSLDAAEVHDHAVGLANAFRERIDLGPSDSAIVSWPDPDGAHLAAFGAAGVAASGRAGRARVSFHLWNDEEDVDLAARSLGR